MLNDLLGAILEDMGHYVHINVCFVYDRNEGVVALAKHLLETENAVAKWFLRTWQSTGNNPGPKGGLSGDG
jgi:hypothetical protein